MSLIICPECKEEIKVTTKKFFHRRPERRGNKIVRCPECGYKITYNKIFRTTN